MKLRMKIILIFSTLFLIGTLGMGAFASYMIDSEMVGSAQEKLQADLALGYELLDAKYPGDWEVRGDKLYKGDQLLNGDEALVDQIGKVTGDTVTIFLGDTRVATNVKEEDGTRAVGTHVSAEVAQTTLKDGRMFIGEANVVGTLNEAAYQPIKNGQGEIIGIWYVGVPKTRFDELVADFIGNLSIFAVIGMAAAVVVSYFVATYIAKPLIKMARVAHQVAEGDLRVEPLASKARDEIGQLSGAIDRMVLNLREVIERVNETSIQVASSSEELSASTDQTARATEQITETIQEVALGAESQVNGANDSATAMEEMTQGIQRIAETSSSVAEASQETAREAEQGNEAVQQAVLQMTSIRTTVRSSADGVKVLEQRSLEIGKIIEVITAIADQTNLLALNAAIEAARAGEHGRGFAVVADEVRKLAEQTTQSAGQIAELIGIIRTDTTQAALSMETATQEVEQGTEVVQKAGDAFSHILNASREVAYAVEEVSAASEQMAASSEMVATTVGELLRIAQTSAGSAQNVAAASQEQLASVEEISTSADSLAQLAHELREMVSKFQV
ncbi:MAG TPA: methyl-accepting chemotaxis protein [Bacilli bacterium]|nr:methyl-accepting chemotaxis protein [Bacilli bacterium]